MGGLHKKSLTVTNKMLDAMEVILKKLSNGSLTKEVLKPNLATHTPPKTDLAPKTNAAQVLTSKSHKSTQFKDLKTLSTKLSNNLLCPSAVMLNHGKTTKVVS